MSIIATVLVALVALEHIGFLVLEMFLWTTPFGQRTFGLTPEFAAASKVLAQNQGLYNGFLAAGLVWSFLIADDPWRLNVRTFFLACVLVAGLYGGYTAKPSIYVVQALPALLALIAVRVAARG
jgi:putative membrane protein